MGCSRLCLLVCLLLSLFSLGSYSVVAADNPLDTVSVTLYNDAACAIPFPLAPPENFTVIDPGMRCGLCIPDNTQSATVICAQSSSSTLFISHLWPDSNSCSGNYTAAVTANITNTPQAANTFCTAGVATLGPVSLDLYMIIDCGNNSPDPSAGVDHLTCDFSTKQKILIISLAAGAAVLLCLSIGCCVYMCRRRSAAARAALLAPNYQNQTQVLVVPQSQQFLPVSTPSTTIQQPYVYGYTQQVPTQSSHSYVRF